MTPESIRVLIPSPLGALGLELADARVIRVVIAPAGKERRSFVPFTEISPDDYVDEVAGRFSEYFAGARLRLDLEYALVAPDLDPFSRRVLRETARIPYGRTRTHQQIAAAAGKRDGYRQVLATLLVNPLPLIIPCHRVVPAGSDIGTWIGGSRKKSQLLRLESQHADEN
ncbi:MAG: methylated-DNA--[protein]-cysteine S-methyltransferase [Thermoanaerobaculia bacterium]